MSPLCEGTHLFIVPYFNYYFLPLQFPLQVQGDVSHQLHDLSCHIFQLVFTSRPMVQADPVNGSVCQNIGGVSPGSCTTLDMLRVNIPSTFCGCNCGAPRLALLRACYNTSSCCYSAKTCYIVVLSMICLKYYILKYECESKQLHGILEVGTRGHSHACITTVHRAAVLEGCLQWKGHLPGHCCCKHQHCWGHYCCGSYVP
jgi:hypothetical protein